MLCPVCRHQLVRTDARCHACGTPRSGREALDLVLPSGERVPVDRELVIGRGDACDLRLTDPSVSRVHAVIDAAARTVADAGSSYGTFLDGHRLTAPAPLRAGATIELGDCTLSVDRRVDRAAAAVTVSVPAGLSVVVEQPGARRGRMRGVDVRRPRLRSGWSLKRLAATEGPERYVLKDHRSGAFVRLGEPEASLVQMCDGSRELVDLVAEAVREWGAEGPGRLARLLADLADRGLLAGVADSPPSPGGWLSRLVRPRERELPGVPALFARAYRRGGFVLFTRVGLAALSALAVVGLAAFIAVIARRYGTPFIVASRVGLGALVFIAGRFLLVVCHELSHGLVAESFGRPVSRVGIKVALVFPYVFVDTTDAWFESRCRRMAISLAGPASDVILGGAFALGCWFGPAGTVRDVCFQVAFAGYVGALFNLNPLLERDGYHVLVDLLREPNLRRRAAEQLSAVLSGARRVGSGGRLLWYGIASLCWSALTVAFAVVLSLRYYHRLASLAPPALVWTVLCAFYIVLVLPLAVQLLGPLWRGVRRVESVAP